jgi:hypothetical protein
MLNKIEFLNPIPPQKKVVKHFFYIGDSDQCW